VFFCTPASGRLAQATRKCRAHITHMVHREYRAQRTSNGRITKKIVFIYNTTQQQQRAFAFAGILTQNP
jgi:hypothetical protein